MKVQEGGSHGWRKAGFAKFWECVRKLSVRQAIHSGDRQNESSASMSFSLIDLSSKKPMFEIIGQIRQKRASSPTRVPRRQLDYVQRHF